MDNNAWLAHHGIKGQKWGHRQGPPYPLKESNHSTAERKAGWKSSLDGNSNNEESKPRHTSPAITPKKEEKKTKEVDPEKAAKRKALAKKIAVGMGVTLAVAAAGTAAYKGMKHLNSNPELMSKMIDQLTDNDVARSVADVGNTAKEFKSNVQKNADKARYNLEANARERARTARSEFDKAEAAYMNKHTRSKEQDEIADAMDYIRKYRNDKYNPINRSKAEDYAKKYGITEAITDEALKQRSDLHRKAAKNLMEQRNQMTEAYNKAYQNYANAAGANERNKRKRAKMQRIMQEALSEKR